MPWNQSALQDDSYTNFYGGAMERAHFSKTFWTNSSIYSDMETSNDSETTTDLAISQTDCTTIATHLALSYDQPHFWLYLGIYVGLVLFAGMMSGLTLAIFSLDMTSLKVIQMAGSAKDKKYASRIMPLASRQYLVLCSLVLANALAVEAMPITLDVIADPVTAIAISVSAVLVFGEVLPQAICGRYGLAIGYYFAWLVWTLIALLFIVSWPLSMILEWLLGKNHGTFYRRAELQALVDIHGPTKLKKPEPKLKEKFNFLRKKADMKSEQHLDENKASIQNIVADAQQVAEDRLTVDEVLIIRGALDLTNKDAKSAMVSLENVYMLAVDDNIDSKKLLEILHVGHSRIPIYSDRKKENVEGVLLVKRLITADPNKPTAVKEFLRDERYYYKPYCVDSKTSLYSLLSKFQEGKSTHMCFVSENIDGQAKIVGVITLEDIIEELLQQEILDETDLVRDLNNKVKLARAALKNGGYEAKKKKSEKVLQNTESNKGSNKSGKEEKPTMSPIRKKSNSKRNGK